MVPELETSLVNAVLTNGARYYVDHAHPEISNPETTTALEAVRWDRAAEEIIRISVDAANAQLAWDNPRAGRRRDRRLQEQLRRQGQQLRLPRELPARAGDAVRAAGHADHAALRDPADLLRRRQGRVRSARSRARLGALPAQPARRLLRGGDRARNHVEAPDRQHAGRTARRCPEVPAAPRHRRRREHVARSPRTSRWAPRSSCCR